MPLRSVQHYICCSHYRKGITTRFRLHFYQFLSVSPPLDCVFSRCIVKPAAVNPEATLRLAGDDVISFAEVHAIGQQRRLYQSADFSLSFMFSWGEACIGRRLVTSLPGSSHYGGTLQKRYFRHTLQWSANGSYNRMKGNSAQGFVNTPQVCTHTCTHANKHACTSRLNGIHTFIIHTFTHSHMEQANQRVSDGGWDTGVELSWSVRRSPWWHRSWCAPLGRGELS